MTCTKTRTGMTAAVLAITAAVAIQVAANAADKTFTKDNGDLASAADWGGTKPANTDRLRFAADSAITATASSDITFAGIYLNKQYQTVTLDMRDEVTGVSPRRITLTDHIYIGDQSDQTLNIRGGYWDLVGKLNLYWRGGTSATTWELANKRQRVNVTDGAVIDVFRITTGYGPESSSSLHVAGEGTTINSAVLRIGAQNACYDAVDIVDGAKIVVTNNGTADLVIGYSGNQNNYNCGLVVSGACSRLVKKNPGSSFVGHMWAHNCYLHVLDGAAAEISGTLYCAGTTSESASYGHDNSILVAGSGSSFACDVVYFGCSNGSTYNHGNRIEVRDGATFAGNLLYVGGNGNGVVVSNATVSLTGGGVKDNVETKLLGTNIFVRLQGATPKFTTDRTGTTGGRNILHKSFKFIYDLPADGYASDFKPVQFLSESATDKSLEIEVNGIEAVLESMKARNVFRQSMVLLSASGGWSANEGVTSDMVARWNSKLPEGAALAYANNVLTLKLKRKAGIVLVVR